MASCGASVLFSGKDPNGPFLGEVARGNTGCPVNLDFRSANIYIYFHISMSLNITWAVLILERYSLI